jgi:hypothetical protein
VHQHDRLRGPVEHGEAQRCTGAIESATKIHHILNITNMIGVERRAAAQGERMS